MRSAGFTTPGRVRLQDLCGFETGCRHVLVTMCVVAAALSCGPKSDATKPDERTARIQLPSCEIQLPPVRDRSGNIAEVVRQYFRTEDLCKMATALKQWMETAPLPPTDLQPGDWARVKWVEIYRAPEAGAGPNATTYEFDMYADVPGRPRMFGVKMFQTSGEMQFFVVQR